ncbi:MAG: ABC transporter substrate-binding protein [Gemmatimonadaceae bacterium]
MEPLLRLAVLSIAAMLTLGCAKDSTPVWFGTAGPWDQGYGQMNKRGIDLALEEINARGGINGRRLQLVSRNDEGDGAKATAIASEFLANDQIAAVVGHVTSGAMVAAARVYDQGLPAVATTVSTPDLSGMSPYVFRVISSDSANGIDLARFARRRGFKRVSVLYENNAYGRGLTEAFSRAFGGEMLSSDPIPTEGTGDFEPYIAFLQTRQPDLIFVAGTEGSGKAVLREARKRGLHAAFIGGDGWTGVVADSAAAEGAFVGAPFTALDERPEAQRFVRAFRERYHVDPDGNAALGYDATMLLARAVEHAGSSRKAIRQWLAALDEDTAFPGVTGPIRFLPSGDVAGKGIVVTQIRAGVLVPASTDGRS